MGTRDGRFYSGLIKWAGVQTVNRVYLYGLVGVGSVDRSNQIMCNKWNTMLNDDH